MCPCETLRMRFLDAHAAVDLGQSLTRQVQEPGCRTPRLQFAEGRAGGVGRCGLR